MRLFELTRRAPPDPLDDLDILETGLQTVEGRDEVAYLWYRLRERERGQTHEGYRVVRLVELRFLPQETRHDAGLVAKTRSAVIGLYDSKARFDLVQAMAGIFDPPLGILQCYGVAAIEPDLEQAVQQSELGLAALKATLANFVQSEFTPLTHVKAAWIVNAMREMTHALVAIGHPDPRENPRGGGRESPDEQKDLSGQSAYTLQQNELLFRGMSRLKEEFLWLLLAHRVDRDSIARMLAGIAAESSVWASRTSGVKGISFGLSAPILLSGGIGRSAGAAYGESETGSVEQQVGDSHSTSRQQGVTDTTSHTLSHEHSHQWGVAHTELKSENFTHTEGAGVSQSHTEGTSESWGTADTHGGSASHSVTTTHIPQVISRTSSQATTHVPDVTSRSATHTNSQETSAGATVSQGAQSGWSQSDAAGQSIGSSHGHTTGRSVGASVGGQVGFGLSEGIDGGIPANTLHGSLGASQSASVSGSVNVGVSVSDADTQSQVKSQEHADGLSGGVSSGLSVSSGVSSGKSDAVGQATSLAHDIVSQGGGVTVTPAHSVTTESSTYTSLDTHTDSHERGVSASYTKGTSAETSDARGTGTSYSVTHSEGWGESWGEAWGTSHAVSRAESESWGTARGLSMGRTFGVALGRTLGAARSLGISGGIVPSLTATKSYNWTDDAMAQVTQLLRTQQQILGQATMDGGFLTDVYMLCRTPHGRTAAEALLRQAFQGDQMVVTAVQSRRLTADESEYIRRHAAAFTPSTRVERMPGLLEGYKDTTFLIPLQLAAYLAPGMFERGTAVTTQERIPPFAFYPEMEGQVTLGYQWDYETRELTDALVRLSPERHMHTAFIGDTGVGKTVAAERLCVETALRWHHRNIVLDFGTGWRELLFSPLPRSRVDIRQLYPGAVRPLRWNLLQIGRRIDPSLQALVTAELVANAGQMGPRQLGYLQRALRELYLQHGVLTSDRLVLADPDWNHVRDRAEAEACRASVGAPLASLSAAQRQALAIHRSKRVDVTDWVDRLREYHHKLDPKATQDRQSLEGILLRLEPFAQGELARMYGKGDDSIAIEDLGLLGPEEDRWGVAVVEGGASLNAFNKSVVLGLIAWHLYHDAIVRQRESVGQPLTPMNVFFEEANKILAGVPATSGSTDEGRASSAQVAEQFQAMFRDGRKYNFLCHVMLQSAAEIAPGILSSCPNVLVGQTKALRDRDLVMGMLHKSEKGFTDEEYKRFVSRIPQQMFVCKLGFTDRAQDMEPMLIRPLRIVATMPTDQDIAEAFGMRAVSFAANPTNFTNGKGSTEGARI